MAGFDNALAFKNIADKDIDDNESYMKENSSASFKFRPGDLRVISALVAHVKKIVDGNGNNSGLAHFAKPIVGSDSKSVDQTKESRTHYFLKKLLAAADRNSQRKKGGY